MNEQRLASGAQRARVLACGSVIVLSWCGCGDADEARRPGQAAQQGSGGSEPSTGGVSSGGSGTTVASGGSGGVEASAGGSEAAGGTTTGSGGSSVSQPPNPYCASRDHEAIPLVVSQSFVPSGFMGDHEDITLIEDGCPERSGVDAAGDCYAFVYEPTGPNAWAGVMWQYPLGNWGEVPGLCVASGATKVGFWARGQQGGEPVNFGAAGIALGDLSLSTTWTYYEIPLGAADYNESGGQGGVASGFSWAAAGGTPKTFYVDDVRWLP